MPCENTEKQGDKNYEMREVEIGAMHLQLKEYPGLSITARNWQGERQGSYFPSELSEGTKCGDTLISHFSPPELGENTFLL